MSDSVRPHRRQPNRLPCPWDSPGKNTGVGCHFLLQCRKVKSESRSVVSNSSRPHGLQPTRLLHPWDFPGKSTGVGCHCLLRLPPLTTLYKTSPLLQRKGPPQEFPGSPVVKTPHFHCRVYRLHPGWGTKILQIWAKPKKEKKVKGSP